jgi:hypothetical protein
MQFVVLADMIIIFFCLLTCLIALTFLSMALVHHRRCFNFPTLLACNTCLATFLFASSNLAIAVYMYVWDQQIIVTADLLCPIRAYLHYSTTALMFYSYILQAVQRYCQIKGINIINTRTRQLLLVIIQWIFAFTFDLPILLTGHLNKLLSDNMCFLPTYEAGLTIYTAGLMFGTPNIVVTVLYRSLVSHVRTTTSTTTVISQRKMNRDLTMVRRIVLLVSLLIFCGLPFCIFVVIAWIDSSRLPFYHLHVAFITLNASLPIMLASLLWITPDLRQSLLYTINKVRPQPQVAFINNRVKPMLDNAPT